jgi:hypothetical protein
MTTVRLIYLSGILALAVSGNASAGSIVYNNLGSGTTVYNTLMGSLALGKDAFMLPGSPSLSEVAFSFTPVVNFSFTELDLALLNNLGSPTSSVIIELTGSSSGLPGSVLQSWSLSAGNLPQSLSPCCTLQTLTGNGTIQLISGATYFVALLPGDNVTNVGWYWNSTGVVQTPFRNTGGGWSPLASTPAGAFEVQGNILPMATPEPAPMLTVSLSMVGLLSWLKRRTDDRKFELCRAHSPLDGDLRRKTPRSTSLPLAADEAAPGRRPLPSPSC